MVVVVVIAKVLPLITTLLSPSPSVNARRYYSLNFQSLYKHGTVEFRQPHAVASADTVSCSTVADTVQTR